MHTVQYVILMHSFESLVQVNWKLCFVFPSLLIHTVALWQSPQSFSTNTQTWWPQAGRLQNGTAVSKGVTRMGKASLLTSSMTYYNCHAAEHSQRCGFVFPHRVYCVQRCLCRCTVWLAMWSVCVLVCVGVYVIPLWWRSTDSFLVFCSVAGQQTILRKGSMESQTISKAGTTGG